MDIKEITISYGEKRSKDYQSEDHHLSITLHNITEDDLIEHTPSEWFYFYDNKLRKDVNEMFKTEKKEPEPEYKTKTLVTQEIKGLPNASKYTKELKTYWDMRNKAEDYESFASEKQKNYLKVLEKKLLKAKLIEDTCQIEEVNE